MKDTQKTKGFFVPPRGIELTHCKLKDLNYIDLLKIKDWRNSQIDVLRQNKLLTDEDQKNYWDKIKNREKEKLFAIFNLENSLIGYGGFVHIKNHNKSAEVSFLLNTKIREGTSEYALLFEDFFKYLIDFGFKEFGLNRIFTETYDIRPEIIRILEKVGFKLEGTLRENIIINSVFHNSLIHSIIKLDLRAINEGN